MVRVPGYTTNEYKQVKNKRKQLREILKMQFYQERDGVMESISIKTETTTNKDNINTHAELICYLTKLRGVSEEGQDQTNIKPEDESAKQAKHQADDATIISKPKQTDLEASCFNPSTGSLGTGGPVRPTSSSSSTRIPGVMETAQAVANAATVPLQSRHAVSESSPVSLLKRIVVTRPSLQPPRPSVVDLFTPVLSLQPRPQSSSALNTAGNDYNGETGQQSDGATYSPTIRKRLSTGKENSRKRRFVNRPAGIKKYVKPLEKRFRLSAQIMPNRFNIQETETLFEDALYLLQLDRNSPEDESVKLRAIMVGEPSCYNPENQVGRCHFVCFILKGDKKTKLKYSYPQLFDLTWFQATSVYP